uniref:Uncharacterized protein n=1 Tax=Rhizophora mucronata TaxID=61149 RepID=A0A2P2P228_RHIMU
MQHHVLRIHDSVHTFPVYASIEGVIIRTKWVIASKLFAGRRSLRAVHRMTLIETIFTRLTLNPS